MEYVPQSLEGVAWNWKIIIFFLIQLHFCLLLQLINIQVNGAALQCQTQPLHKHGAISKNKERKEKKHPLLYCSNRASIRASTAVRGLDQKKKKKKGAHSCLLLVHPFAQRGSKCIAGSRISCKIGTGNGWWGPDVLVVWGHTIPDCSPNSKQPRRSCHRSV